MREKISYNSSSKKIIGLKVVGENIRSSNNSRKDIGEGVVVVVIENI